MKVWDALVIGTTSSKLSWYRGLSSVPGDKLRDEPSGNTAPYAWPGQVCAPQFDLHG